VIYSFSTLESCGKYPFIRACEFVFPATSNKLPALPVAEYALICKRITSPCILVYSQGRLGESGSLSEGDVPE